VEPLKNRNFKKGPESKIQDAIKEMLAIRGWYVLVTHGNTFQSGFPDLFACHSTYGQRWIEVKKPNFKGSRFTPAQLECFPKICANGSGVWILTSEKESEYQKLFKRPNWWCYLESFR